MAACNCAAWRGVLLISCIMWVVALYLCSFAVCWSGTWSSWSLMLFLLVSLEIVKCMSSDWMGVLVGGGFGEVHGGCSYHVLLVTDRQPHSEALAFGGSLLLFFIEPHLLSRSALLRSDWVCPSQSTPLGMTGWETLKLGIRTLSWTCLRRPIPQSTGWSGYTRWKTWTTGVSPGPKVPAVSSMPPWAHSIKAPPPLRDPQIMLMVIVESFFYTLVSEFAERDCFAFLKKIIKIKKLGRKKWIFKWYINSLYRIYCMEDDFFPNGLSASYFCSLSKRPNCYDRALIFYKAVK